MDELSSDMVPQNQQPVTKGLLVGSIRDTSGGSSLMDQSGESRLRIIRFRNRYFVDSHRFFEAFYLNRSEGTNEDFVFDVAIG